MPAPPDNEVGPAAARRPTHLSLNLTAMIDVVFLLLIYFLAATQFKIGEEVYRHDLPLRGVADPFELPRDPVRIAIATTARGNALIRLAGAPGAPRTFSELTELLRENQRGEGAIGGLFETDHPIVVQPAPNTRWEHVMAAFNSAARARYTNITFAPSD